MADVKGGRGVTGISFSGKGNLEKPSSSKLARELGSTFSKTTMTNPIGRRYGEAIGPMKPKNVPRTFVPSPRKPVPPAVAVLPPVKKPVQVVSNVVRERPTPTPVKAAPPARAKPPATRFGVVTGTKTGTKVSGGGGYGGGGTRGGGSLSGGGSGSRSAGTSRTGGTRSNDPVRG